MSVTKMTFTTILRPIFVPGFLLQMMLFLPASTFITSFRCFLYSNGITDHLYLRLNGDPPPTVLHTAEEICNCKWYNRPKYFNGTLDAFFKISRTEGEWVFQKLIKSLIHSCLCTNLMYLFYNPGVRSLWSGLSPSLALALPTTVLYLTSYEQIKTALSDRVWLLTRLCISVCFLKK